MWRVGVALETRELSKAEERGYRSAVPTAQTPESWPAREQERFISIVASLFAQLVSTGTAIIVFYYLFKWSRRKRHAKMTPPPCNTGKDIDRNGLDFFPPQPTPVAPNPCPW